MDNAALVPHWESKFRRDAIIRTIHYGTHLEGNPLSKEQVEAVVGDDIPLPTIKYPVGDVVARERDIQEVLNYRQVLRYIDNLGVPVVSSYGRIKTDFTPYTLEILSQVHRMTSAKILPESEQGKIRKVAVVIRNKATGAIIYRPPSPAIIGIQLADFFNWLNRQDGRENHHPVIRAGIAHWEIVRIHPYTDGNGRTARAMALLVLFQEGYDVKRFFSIEQYFDQNPKDYYQALASVGTQKDGNMTAWLEYFTEGLAIELSRVKELVQALSRDLRLKNRLGYQVALTERQIKILQYIELNDRLGTTELNQVLPMTSRDTILREVKYLVEKGLVQKIGVTKSARYVLK